jgi:hypothetical protein
MRVSLLVGCRSAGYATRGPKGFSRGGKGSDPLGRRDLPMYGGRLSPMMAPMHSLNASTIAKEFVESRVDSAARARRFRVRRRFARGERRDAPSSSAVPPGRLSTSVAER